MDCAQRYHQIRVWVGGIYKLVFFAPDTKKYTFGVLPFGPVNAPLIYTIMIWKFQAERIHLFQLFCNNKSALIIADKSQPMTCIPSLQRSYDNSKFRIDNHLLDLLPDKDYVLTHKDQSYSVPPSDTHTSAIITHQRTLDSALYLITGSRIIIDDILLWGNSQSTVLLMFECMCRVLMKY